MSTPHVRLNTDDLKEQYRTGKMTVKGYIYNWLLAARKRGWRLRTTVSAFCEELGISRSAFYKAIAELRSDPGSDFRFEARGEIEMWIETVHDCGQLSTVVDTESTIVDKVSTIVDKVSTIVDKESTVVDKVSTVVENRGPEAAQGKASRDPSTLYSFNTANTTGIQGTAAMKNGEEQPKQDPELSPESKAAQFRKLKFLAQALLERTENVPAAAAPPCGKLQAGPQPIGAVMQQYLKER